MTLWTLLALMLATIVQELNKGILSAIEMVTHLMETFQNQGKGCWRLCPRANHFI